MNEPWTPPAHLTAPEQGLIGTVIQVTGSGVVAVCDPELMNRPLIDAEAAFMPSGQIGSIVKIGVQHGYIFATVREVRASENYEATTAGSIFDSHRVYVDLDFMGHQVFTEDGSRLSSFRRGVADFPIPGQKVLMVTKPEMEEIFSAEGADLLKIGTVYPHYKTSAILLTDHLLGKHFAVLGSTGTGKSCAVSLLLHRLVEQLPNGHVLVLDPHGEYGRAFAGISETFTTENLELPYWLMTFDEHVEVFVGRRNSDRDLEIDILKRCLLQARTKDTRNRSLARVTVDTPVPYKISDLVQSIDNEMGRLDKPEKVIPYLRLKTKIEELRKDQRYGFMFSGLLLNDNLAEILSRLLRFPGNDRPISIIDLSGVPSDIVDVVVGVLCRVVFDFALWSRGRNARPILLVCEEAHRYVSAKDGIGNSAARLGIERIAKEGRKYGVSLGLISQRPAELSESALSQCGTIIAMRMNNERDQAFVEHVLPEGAKGFLAALPSLQNREVLIVGEGVKAPVRALLDELPEDQRPSSESPRFSDHWQQAAAGTAHVADVVTAWRMRSG
ncbi:ATP-binding protein [Govanella unica]|uniref:DUF87 domain-containing protein n=1 Tax=Govanella unica TaxID=2975056 RepID=A0A9X3Z896_9PROT|nr:DUF87 domain-containing protein [Govania unica]MDA5194883.1 DUF87 domain-containing protein [Govania unica]